MHHFSRNAVAGKKEITFAVQHLAWFSCLAYSLQKVVVLSYFCSDEETSKLEFIFPKSSKSVTAKGETYMV